MKERDPQAAGVRCLHVHTLQLPERAVCAATLAPLFVQVPMDLCEPCWSNAYRFTREVLAEY